MTQCAKCSAGSDDQELSFTDGRHEWWSCLKCGKMRSVRVQSPRGCVVFADGTTLQVVEYSGEFESK